MAIRNNKPVLRHNVRMQYRDTHDECRYYTPPRWLCGECLQIIDDAGFTFCPHCGKELNWTGQGMYLAEIEERERNKSKTDA